MPSIVLSDIAYTAPDGRELFSHLDLSFGRERVGLVGRNGTGKSTLLRLVAGELQPAHGTVSVDGAVAVLRQELQAQPDETVADRFGARAALAVLARAEHGEATAQELAEADWTIEARIEAALARLGIAVPPLTPLAALSGGQRTRVALAALVFRAPDILLLDEPTNNLDRDGRAAVHALLAGWRGGAVVVSHDRELLEAMDAIVELTSLGASRYGGGWSAYRARKELELDAAQRDLAEAGKQAAEARQAAQAIAERKARKDGAGRRKAARGDAPKILLGGMKARSEQTGGAQARLAERQDSEAQEALEAARARVEVLTPLSVTLPATGLPAGRTVLALDRVSVGYTPENPVIGDLSLTITGPERIALAGPNGSGKTTLLSLIAGKLAPLSGEMRVTERFAMLDQSGELLDPEATIRDNFRRLNPESGENACRAALARFMFRADAALQRVSALSGGQMLRAGLACALGGPTPPYLLVLDEPTNHLDLDSIAAVEAGLRAYDGALLVVSHDEAFLAAIGITRRVELPARS